MKKLPYLFLVLLIFGLNYDLTGQIEEKIAHFKFSIESRGNEIILKSIDGFHWTELKTSQKEGKTYFTIVNDGIYPVKKKFKCKKPKIIIYVEKTFTEIKMVSEKGTSWKTLTFSCGTQLYPNCTEYIDENGMTTKNN